MAIKQSSSGISGAPLYAGFGVVLGFCFVFAATLLALHVKGQAVSWDAALAAHASQPLLWFFDVSVLLLALLGALFGDLQSRLGSVSASIDASVDLRTRDLVEANEKLAREKSDLEQAEQALRQAMEEADIASYTRAELMTQLGRDIRTPMHGLLGMIELMLDSAIPGKQQAVFESARQSSRDLLAVLNETIDFSNAETGQLDLTPEPFSLERLVRETTAVFHTSGARKFIHVDAGIGEGVPDALIGDPRRIRQVLGQFLDNAVRFTDAGSIDLHVQALEASDGKVQLRFSVKDTGVGMAEAKQRQLFETPTPSGDAGSASNGMGLAIAKRLVDLMGGEIGVQSQAGQGSTFWFSARFATTDASAVKAQGDAALAQGAKPASAQEPTGAMPLRPLKVLVAEDNLVNQHFARAVLESAGHQVELASNGREALAAALRSTPDVILMDCQMPEMNGYEATRQIRSRGLGAVRIFALTANAQREDRELCIAAGMDDYLTTPYSRQELADLLRRWFGAAQGEAPARAEA